MCEPSWNCNTGDAIVLVMSAFIVTNIEYNENWIEINLSSIESELLNETSWIKLIRVIKSNVKWK